MKKTRYVESEYLFISAMEAVNDWDNNIIHEFRTVPVRPLDKSLETQLTLRYNRQENIKKKQKIL